MGSFEKLKHHNDNPGSEIRPVARWYDVHTVQAEKLKQNNDNLSSKIGLIEDWFGVGTVVAAQIKKGAKNQLPPNLVSPRPQFEVISRDN